MANYDLSRPAPDRRDLFDAGTGAGGIGLICVGAVVVLVLLYMVFTGTGVPGEPGGDAVVSGAAAVTADQ